MPQEDVIKLFDKNLATSVQLAAFSSWRFKLKKPFNIFRIKVLYESCDYVPGIKIVTYVPVAGQPGTPYGNPASVDTDEEIKWIDITNMNNYDVDIAEIIAEIFQITACFPIPTP
jgi:hypothetical protein